MIRIEPRVIEGILRKGTLVHIDGVRVELVVDTQVKTNFGNWVITQDLDQRLHVTETT